MRWLILLGLSLAICTTGHAQNVNGDVARDSISALQRFLNENGKSARVTADMTAKFDVAIDRFSGCDVELRVTTDIGNQVTVNRFSLVLGRLSPDLDVESRAATGDIFGIRVVTTSGAEEIPTAVVRGGKPQERQNSELAGFPLQGEVTARRGAALLSSAIRACGGLPQTAAVRVKSTSGPQSFDRAFR